MEVSNTVTTCIVLLILFCGSAAGSRTKLFSFQAQQNGVAMAAALASSSQDGICNKMVVPQGYPCEEHMVTTEDGYILSLQRIPTGRSGGTPGNSQPVLLQHGLLVDGITWLLLPPEQSLAFALADNGFDVWIANSRGTKYSLGHTSLSPNDSAYWNWSWDELVGYDLPATFQYVYDQSGQKMHYVGHSQGTLVALAAFSKNQLLSMLRSAALLSPIAYMNQMTSPLAKDAANNFIAEMVYWLGLSEFNLRGDAVINLLKNLCSQPDVDCTNLLTAFTGQNCCLNSSIVDVFLDHEPQPSATKNMVHLAQMIRQGTITMFDYIDPDENMKHYGQTTPPAYNMTTIPNDLPLFLSYGGDDALSDVNDVQRLLDSLKDHDGDKLVVQYRQDYAHADYVMAENARQDENYWDNVARQSKMPNFATLLTLLVLFSLSANAAAIKKLHSSITDDDTICKSLVTTKDGYILSLQRIPSGRSGKTADKPPVLLQHGILVDAAPWLLNSQDESLGFILADNGFDVWLANTRGTTYSRGHTSLSPNDSAYWEWSWDELVQYDLSAFVQYVHDQTNQKLHYVGHSLGTLIALAAFSKQELVNMFRTAALLSPIAHLDQIPSQLMKVAADMHLAETLYNSGFDQFPPGWDVLGPILNEICNKLGTNCSDLMTVMTGANCCINSSKAGELLKHEPQPTATKNIIHLSQMIRTGSIAMYDYGSKDENVGHYGQPTPPAYDMTSIPKDLPLFLGYGGQDQLSDVKDVKSLLNDLKDHDKGNLVELFIKDYAHADFVLGVNANQVVYDPIVSFFNLHST
ncbi:Alpha/beta hydrolase-1 [Corchorus olitorius]|uniref:Alpha/beta hydrolase-1 n=1 Tax=Corchorus olitorius TaxID=93759 RepID=A0A1R3KKF7_9ROSI|nr:Alpha/beta hydrolase-1 [Corchorus olitorius]